jgi:WD40 repeat protein
VVTASADNTLRVWKLTPGPPGTLRIEPRGEALYGHKAAVRQLVISDDGQRILSVSEDQTLRLWDLQSQTLIGTLGVSSRPLTGVTLLPGGRRAATVGDDRTLQLWDIEPSSWVRVACQRAGRDLTPQEHMLLGGLDEQPGPGHEPLGPLCSPTEQLLP